MYVCMYVSLIERNRRRCNNAQNSITTVAKKSHKFEQTAYYK